MSGREPPVPEVLRENFEWWCICSNCAPKAKEQNHSASMDVSLGCFCWMPSPTERFTSSESLTSHLDRGVLLNMNCKKTPAGSREHRSMMYVAYCESLFVAA